MTLDNPASVEERLAQIENDLAGKQNDLELAALTWYRAKREREKARAEHFLTTDGTVAERSAAADHATADIGKEQEASYEALKAVCRVLETRASIGQSILRAQSRVAA